MNEQDLELFVLSHTNELLGMVPQKPFINKVLLSSLNIPVKFQGEELAENRFFISEESNKASGKYIGCISSRWDERFPKFPKIKDLDVLAHSLSDLDVLAPQSLRVTKSQFVSWVNLQDLVHPGMSALLWEVIDRNLSLEKNHHYNIVMGNNFILSRTIYFEFLNFWRKAFVDLNNKFGFDFPFSYRCPICGLESINGIGRWSRLRHSAFLYERLTAIFFASRPDLNLVTYKYSSIRQKKLGVESFALPYSPTIFKVLKIFRSLSSKCDHSYQSPGKK
jgi:hypothetical protein